ncbi:hypothetical protein BCV70DRAFT_17148 [Testicularia cyperi]|uniref:Uncharacterized protein n=1 Tax=Testicularia cyperi TaxID=1882483 RepID=A0A317Y1C6_9BASI|nr:hypothetical protein BCV70DRAFT_17148 [Testicularia cyperi]
MPYCRSDCFPSLPLHRSHMHTIVLYHLNKASFLQLHYRYHTHTHLHTHTHTTAEPPTTTNPGCYTSAPPPPPIPRRVPVLYSQLCPDSEHPIRSLRHPLCLSFSCPHHLARNLLPPSSTIVLSLSFNTFTLGILPLPSRGAVLGCMSTVSFFSCLDVYHPLLTPYSFTL